jgi:hypothetical protein
MASLSTTSQGQLAKYTSGIIEVIEASMKNRTQVKAGTKTYTVDNTPQNKVTLKEYINLSANSYTEKEAKALKLTASGNATFSIGSLDKPKEAGNRGDIAEGILGAAIAARFINKNKNIDTAKVKAVLRDLGPTASKIKQKDFNSENKNPKIIDNVNLYISLAESNMKVLLDPSKWAGLDDLFQSAVKYANGDTVIAWSQLLYNNNQKNNIEVISDGLGNQSGTKVDVKVMVDGVVTNIKVSLKAGDVKQFGQVAGSEFEKQLFLWKTLLEIDVSTKETLYTKHLQNKEVNEALYITYSFVAEQINIKLGGSSSKPKLLRDLGNGIRHFATLNEQDVSLVQLSKNEAIIYTFDKIHDKLKNLDLKAVIKDSAGKPKLVIQNKELNSLIEVRVKAEGRPDGSTYIRNYIEKGEVLGSFLAIKA